jgi:polysaccharide export outer membrane protein
MSRAKGFSSSTSIWVACAFALATAAQLAGQAADIKNQAGVRLKSTVIGPADSVSITALNCEEISKTWRVSISGELNLPMIGRIQASGLTVEQLELALTAKLGKYLREPQVSVFVTEFRSQPVTVMGSVEKPGVIQLEGPKTLFEVLVMAGGPKDPGPTVTIKRGTDHGTLDVPGARMDADGTYMFADLELAEVTTGRGELANIPIKPFDLITVAKAKATRYVHVTGEVTRPGSVELVTQETVSLLKVLAVAGGLTVNANGSKTMIIHVNPDGLQTSTSFIDVSKIENGKARDLELMNGDVLVVPPSNWKSIVHMATASAVSSGIFTAVNVIGRF